MHRFLAAALLVAAAAPAHAHWQFTRWGMTPDEVVGASPVQVGPFSNPDFDTDSAVAKLVSNYSAGGFDFAVGYMFDRATGRLSRVHLELKDPAQCGKLWHSMDAIYGKPSTTVNSRAQLAAKWHDTEAGNVVSVVLLGLSPPTNTAHCSVDYSEAPSKAQSGL